MSAIPKTNLVSDVAYKVLVRTSRNFTNPGVKGRWWWKAWNQCNARWRGAVRVKLHGYDALLNQGNFYPIYSRYYPMLNAPLVEAVNLAHLAKGSPIGFVDVGSATGDSILLVHSNCPGMIGTTYGVDGDPEFVSLLRANVAQIPNCKLRITLLSAEGAEVKELVRTHASTASAQGEATVSSMTLDSAVEADGVGPINVLKIDVDGFDGQVLRGSRQFLTRDRPVVVFEWHPILCKQTGNNWTDHFEALIAAGYDRFVWFTKFGEFSHFMRGYDAGSVAETAKLCFESKAYDDHHYDVVALHESSPVSSQALADLSFARARRHPY